MDTADVQLPAAAARRRAHPALKNDRCSSTWRSCRWSTCRASSGRRSGGGSSGGGKGARSQYGSAWDSRVDFNRDGRVNAVHSVPVRKTKKRVIGIAEFAGT